MSISSGELRGASAPLREQVFTEDYWEWNNMCEVPAPSPLSEEVTAYLAGNKKSLATTFRRKVILAQRHALSADTASFGQEIRLENLRPYTLIRFDAECYQSVRDAGKNKPIEIKPRELPSLGERADRMAPLELLRLQPTMNAGDHTDFLIGCTAEELLAYCNRGRQPDDYVPGYVSVTDSGSPKSGYNRQPSFERKVWYGFVLPAGSKESVLVSFPSSKDASKFMLDEPFHRPLKVGQTVVSEPSPGNFYIERINGLLIER